MAITTVPGIQTAAVPATKTEEISRRLFTQALRRALLLSLLPLLPITAEGTGDVQTAEVLLTVRDNRNN
jgi:hypothetical protein